MNSDIVNFFKNKKVIITGAKGFLGTYVVNYLKPVLSDENLIIPRSKECDLRDKDVTFNYFKKHNPDYIINLAARLGGIGDNRANPALYFYDNISIGLNVIEACRQIKNVKKLVYIGTVCSYPKFTPAPFKESDLWKGYPEETNAPYGIAKKSVMVYSEAVYQQYNFLTNNILLTNLYGPGDDFRDQTSHVIPALIKKIHNAKLNKELSIHAWGDGSPSRDFLYAKDAALGIIQACVYLNTTNPINLGSSKEISIKQLTETIMDLMDYNGNINWDTSKPNGQPRRLLDINLAKNLINFNPLTSFKEGLKETIKYYIDNQSTLDGLAPKY
jgi:nucleoside-diphosphate-sugar epimerase